MSGVETGRGAGRVKVWDAPIRLFHWGIVLLVATSYACARIGWLRLHFLSGYAMIAALVFRVAWGLVGSDTARFARFFAGPGTAFRHLRRLARREPDVEIGHNAAGGWMVLAMLLLLAAQVGTGLFANNDDSVNDGPLFEYAGKALSDRITGWHIRNFNLLLAVIGLHVLAIAAYRLLKGQDLVRPMLTGNKWLPAGAAAPRLRSPIVAALLFAAICAALCLILRRG